MPAYIKEGWGLVCARLHIVVMLFLYRLLWGVFIYQVVQYAVVPILLRYPGKEQSELNQALFWIEGQLALTGERIVQTYIWVIIVMALIRMIVTPIIRAGIYYALHAQDGEHGKLAFFHGMKTTWRSSMLYYWIETCLIWLPGYWILQRLLPHIEGLPQNLAHLTYILPYVAAWISYGWLIKQCILHMQLGTVSHTGAWGALLRCLRYLLPGMTISLLLGLFSCLLFLLFGGVQWLWTGLAALILQQLYHVVTSLFGLWHVSSQYALWHSVAPPASTSRLSS